MRLNRLDLIAYGKFTATPVQLPRSEQDFHLIVGRNEAGKSTLRRGVADLLFGMPLRSSMDFLHPLPELRLGAEMESRDGERLSFVRDRSRGPKSLKTPEGDVLPETALRPFVGAYSRDFFEKMFCIDLAALLAGGQSILQASDDIGRLLFQSAAGITSLGAVRDELDKEADALFGPRASDKRAFYVAQKQHDETRAQLRGLTVNSKAWSLAKDELEALTGRLEAAESARRTLETEQSRLQRIRRVAPNLIQMREYQARLVEIGEGPLFPVDASGVLDAAVRDVAEQVARVEHKQAGVKTLQDQLAAITLDSVTLDSKDDIAAFVKRAQALANHERDIDRREQEVRQLLAEATAYAKQLGWDSDEASIDRMLPTALALKTVTSLLTRSGKVVEVARADARLLTTQTATLVALRARLTGPTESQLSPEFLSSLRQATARRATEKQQRALKAALTTAETALAEAEAGLGAWPKTLDDLRRIPPPSAGSFGRLQIRRAALQSNVEGAETQVDVASRAYRAAHHAAEQYTEGRRLVVMDDVLAARRTRDAAWNAVKFRHVELAAGAPAVDTELVRADHLADALRESAADATHLASLRQAAATARLAVDEAEVARDSARSSLADFDAQWSDQAAQLGLPGMALDAIEGWMQRRDAVLAAHDQVRACQDALQSEQDETSDARQALIKALAAGGVTVPDGFSMDALCTLAEDHKSAVENAATAREALERQIDEAAESVETSTQTAAQSASQLDEWTSKWNEALKAAGLTGASDDVDQAAASVELVNQIQVAMVKVKDLRQLRIAAMRTDLDDFGAEAGSLRVRLAPTSAQTKAQEFAVELDAQLRRALDDQRDAMRLKDRLVAEQAELDVALLALESAKARMSPLQRLAGTDDETELRALIRQADDRRRLASSITTARDAITQAADGLSLEQVEAEVDAVGPDQVLPRLSELTTALDAAGSSIRELTAEHVLAKKAFEAIDDGPEAAQLESRRQESFAEMVEAAERYVKVAAASRMLRWAIDKYRDRKQGPMLKRAGAVFSQLTDGGFERLVPDFDEEPPLLTGVRASGERVAIEAMSEGTRDQLFLALRLAALEMHIENDRPLPFIADDLFVNYHDGRAAAGFHALAELSRRTQVVFLTHHEHLVPMAKQVLGDQLNVVRLG